ncbi:MAG: DUF86 domain-containing protein [Alphaproteobacteria bacterium]|nr:DUF86 domain-containing protein [Alphaproteobacteria bacterium]
MPRGDAERIDDVLAAIADIRADIAGLDFAAFAGNAKTVRSVLYSIGVIGEAVGKLSPGLLARHPKIPWRAIAGIRNRVVHEYFRVSPRRIWEAIADDLETLERVMRAEKAET